MSGLPELEEGELLIRGYGVTQGYYKKEREEVFDAEGWLHTGDRCFIVDNRPFFVGRFYEMIKTRGANVSPREVELVLEGFPDIAHALVFGLPHPELEEEVTAVIVPAPGRTARRGVDPDAGPPASCRRTRSRPESRCSATRASPVAGLGQAGQAGVEGSLRRQK